MSTTLRANTRRGRLDVEGETHNADGTTHFANIETFSSALVWPLQSFFRQGAKPRANGYDGFNQP